MEKLLYIFANPKEERLSKGAEIGNVFLQAVKEINPHVEIEKLFLYKMNIPQVDQDLIYARAKLSFMGYTIDELTQTEREKYEAMHRLCDQFMDAKYYVIVSPLWNFGPPAILKAFMDNMFTFGKTFTRTEDGVTKGLLTNRKAIHIQTRGGIYSTGPMKEFEMGDQYVRKVLSFLGMDVMDSIIAEGMDHFPNERGKILARAKEEAVIKAKEMISPS